MKNNILYISDTGDIIGGGEISLLNILSRLNKDRFFPLVICPSDGELVAEIKNMGIEIKIIPMESWKLPNPVAIINTVNEIIKVMKNNKISLAHANGSRGANYAGIACKIVGIPLIWHVRILESAGLFDRYISCLSDKIIANSNAVKNNRFSWLKNKVEVIYNGIDLKIFNVLSVKGNIRKEFCISSDTPFVATVGRVDWYKGHKYLLAAIKIVKESMPKVRFMIVGDGEYKKCLEKLSKKLEITENVVFTGNRKDIPLILNEIDLFVMSSVSEGFGRVAVEAMACSKPVVATKIGGLEEIVEDGVTGMLVPPINPESLAVSIMELLKNKEMAKKMGISGRKRAEELFSIEKNIDKTEKLYEDILKEENK